MFVFKHIRYMYKSEQRTFVPMTYVILLVYFVAYFSTVN